MKIPLVLLLASLTWTCLSSSAAAEDRLVLTPPADSAGKRIVLVAGDEEYRTEESMPMLAKILSQKHGFHCTVLFALDVEGNYIDPNNSQGVRGWEALDSADLMIIGTRFRKPDAAAAAHIAKFLNAGKPVIGIRTATHAFQGEGNFDGLKYGEFGLKILGETWVNHHGRHKAQGARAVIEPGQADHPVLRGVEDIFCPSDVYGVIHLSDQDRILLRAAVTESLDPSSAAISGEKNDPMQPFAWLHTYQRPNGQGEGKAFCTTGGASVDFVSEDLRRLVVNAAYFLTDREVPAEADVAYVDPFYPSFYGFIRDKDHWKNVNLQPEDFGLGKSPHLPDVEGSPTWNFRETPPAVGATDKGDAAKSDRRQSREPAQPLASNDSRPPNVVYIMSDELAYFELGHMGNAKIRTPHIDRFAREGLRFTQALAAAPVCAPLRCALMTGKHMGHASVRANGGGTPLRAEEATIASLLKQRGYATGGFGKWGAGGRGSTGVPEKHGFDTFFGYYDQVHAHSFYPPYLIHNSQEVPLAGNDGGRSGQTYSHYEIMKRGLEFIRKNRDQPFFCYLPITPPHGMYDIPADDPAWQAYADDEWMKDPNVPQDAKNYAAMVTLVDNNVAQVLELLEELQLTDNTIVFFTGDNGGQDRFSSKQHPRGYFGPNVNPRTGVEFRGGKGNLYEGGLRIPFLVRWPGKIAAGRVSDLLCSQCDVLPTLAELCGAKPPADIDGLSILPEILGSEATGREQSQHDYLYWEFVNQVAVRIGNWKGVRPKADAEWELYDLSTDVSEQHDVAAEHPQMVRRMQDIARQAHTPVQPGTFANTAQHERDRQAKFGFSGKSAAGRR